MMNRTLWVVQALLAALFLYTGGIKLVLPLDALTKQLLIPGWLVRLVAVAEVLGAIGLVLPSALRIWPHLTPLAAGGLVIVMIGATVLTVRVGGGALALIPAVTGMLAAFVAYGRTRHRIPARLRGRRAQSGEQLRHA